MSVWGKLLSVFFLTGVFSACAAGPGNDPDIGPPTFTFSPSAPVVGESVQFTDTSSGDPTSWRWDFGDGQTSTARNPAHAFSSAGSKTVTLTIAKGLASRSASRPVIVEEPLVAAFDYGPASPIVGQPVQFTDRSTGGPTSWLWDFGDGTASTAQNPSHSYPDTGPRTVKLTVNNPSRSTSTTRALSVVADLAAGFTYLPAWPEAGQNVQFADASTGDPTSWMWDFNDGATSLLRDPDHVFSAAGSYTVTLTITKALGSATASRVVAVAPTSALRASFSFSPALPWSGGPVQFTDTSTGAPTSWQWDFGDGTTASSRNPSHAYAAAGSRTVMLTVANGSGSDTASQTLTIAPAAGIIVDHAHTNLNAIPSTSIDQARQKLHIAYGHTSHGSQVTSGMAGLVTFKGPQYSFNSGGSGGALDLRDFYGNFGNLGIAEDLGSPSRTAWASATRTYLAQNPDVNVIIWSWCGQVDGTQAEIQQYLDLMNGLERDFPNVKFVYMTGHTDGAPLTGNVPARNKQIRDYCVANNKILYDFADIESYDPSGNFFGDKLVNDACDYDSNGDGVQDSNWAANWQNAHPGEWYNCESAHSQPLNANQKAYAAWSLWARLAGWDGR